VKSPIPEKHVLAVMQGSTEGLKGRAATICRIGTPLVLVGFGENNTGHIARPDHNTRTYPIYANVLFLIGIILFLKKNVITN
jgi:hypothetical protein